MPKQKVSEAFIIEESLKLFRRKSYHNTSMADIASACGLLKGSIYHYFPSKEALMREVIEHMHDFFKKEVFCHAYDSNLNPQEKMEAMFKASKNIFLSEDGGDVMGNIGVETAIVIPVFAEQIQKFFVEWIAALENVYMQITEAYEAKILAEQTVVEIEGAVMLTRIFGKPKYIIEANKRIKDRFASFMMEQASKINHTK